VKAARFVPSLWLPLILVAMPAVAQPERAAQRSVPGRPSLEQERSQLQVANMERVLESVVETTHGRQLEAMMPEMFTFEGVSRARGFRLEGYGVFFDVDLPPVPRSVEWTLKVLDTGAILTPDVQSLKRQVASIQDAQLRRQFDTIIQRMEAKLVSGATLASGSSGGSDSAPPGNVPVSTRGLRGDEPSPRRMDPVQAYLTQLRTEIAYAMVDYGGTIQVGADDWLTVAAREVQARLVPGAPTETTLTFRIKGGDLAAFQARQISREEAVKRVEIK